VPQLSDRVRSYFAHDLRGEKTDVSHAPIEEAPPAKL
jgi:hypothetical protein